MDNSRYIAKHVASLPKSGIRDFFDIVAKMKDAISLGVGEPDFVTPEHIRQAGIASIQQGDTHYTSNWGTLALREAGADVVMTERVGSQPIKPLDSAAAFGYLPALR